MAEPCNVPTTYRKLRPSRISIQGQHLVRRKKMRSFAHRMFFFLCFYYLVKKRDTKKRKQSHNKQELEPLLKRQNKPNLNCHNTRTQLLNETTTLPLIAGAQQTVPEKKRYKRSQSRGHGIKINRGEPPLPTSMDDGCPLDSHANKIQQLHWI